MTLSLCAQREWYSGRWRVGLASTCRVYVQAGLAAPSHRGPYTRPSQQWVTHQGCSCFSLVLPLSRQTGTKVRATTIILTPELSGRAAVTFVWCIPTPRNPGEKQAVWHGFCFSVGIYYITFEGNVFGVQNEQIAYRKTFSIHIK